MKRLSLPVGSCLVLFLALAVAAPAIAQETETPEAKKEAKALAKEERIQEYLRKKEERRLRREAEAKLQQEEADARRTAEEMAEAEQPPVVKEKKSRDKSKKQTSTQLPRQLEKTHADLRASKFGQDPTVATYLNLIETGQASAQQIAAFGNFLGQAGRVRTALAYYDLALSLDRKDPTIWLNAGTLQRQIGNYGAAASAYVKVLGLDSSHAFAHYNLGAVLDEMGDYDASIEEYKMALTLDPTLGDPSINPQAANNEKLMAVRLMLYKEQTGAIGLPLVIVPDGEVGGGN